MSGVQGFINAKKFQRVLILGTPTTVAQGLYSDCAPGALYPSVVQQRAISRIIQRVLGGKYWQRDRDYIARLSQHFKKSKNIDAVVLGCTELSVLFKESRLPGYVRLIDPLKLLACNLITGVNLS